MIERPQRQALRNAAALRLCCCVFIAALAGVAFAEEHAAAEQVEFGAELYAEFCSDCHGDDVAGLEGFADSAAEFAARLEGETENMPDFTDFFSAEEVSAMYGFLSAVAADNSDVAGE